MTEAADALCQSTKARWLMALGQYEEAIAILEGFVQSQPDHPVSSVLVQARR